MSAATGVVVGGLVALVALALMARHSFREFDRRTAASQRTRDLVAVRLMMESKADQ